QYAAQRQIADPLTVGGKLRMQFKVHCRILFRWPGITPRPWATACRHCTASRRNRRMPTVCTHRHGNVMRASHYLISTLKENPADAEVISHQLMLRAGLIRKLASGLYSWLPMGLRVLRKVEQVVR